MTSLRDQLLDAELASRGHAESPDDLLIEWLMPVFLAWHERRMATADDSLRCILSRNMEAAVDGSADLAEVVSIEDGRPFVYLDTALRVLRGSAT